MHLPVIVVGAGPAGSVAAIVLARAKVPVLLVEQHRFPRDKVCGECISALGVSVLSELQLIDGVRDAGAIQLDRATFFAPSGEGFEVRLPQKMLGLSRARLDLLLVEQAARGGVEIRQPARVEAVASGDVPTVRVRDLRTNQVETLSCAQVILADGKAALLPSRPVMTAEMGIKAHFADVAGPRDAIELFVLDGEYGGIAAVEEGRWNVALSVKTTRVQAFQGDIARLFAELVGSNRLFERRLRGARRVSAWLAAPLPRFAVVTDWPAGVIPVGNAAAAIDPVGGEGIGLAMRSATIAARAIIEARATGQPVCVARIKSDYRRLWSTRAASCRAVALGVSRPRLADFAMWAFRDSHQISELALHLMGKS